MEHTNITTKVVEHLKGMCNGPVEIVVTDITPVADDAMFIHFTFDGESQGAIYYPSDDVLFTPSDWQGVIVGSIDDVESVDWISSAFDPALMVNGMPRLFAACRDDARKEYGRKVAARREEMDMDAAELARRSGLSQSNIERIEAGRYNVTLDTMTRIRVALGDF